jgi:DnaJ-domain-containing protein 1
MSSEVLDDPPPPFEAVESDPFEVLGVDKAATDEEIKAAYRKLVLKCVLVCSHAGQLARPLHFLL